MVGAGNTWWARGTRTRMAAESPGYLTLFRRAAFRAPGPPSAVVLQVRPERPPAAHRAGADADVQAAEVARHVVRRVVGRQHSAVGEIRAQPAERVDDEHDAVGGPSGSPHPVVVVAGEHRRQAP